MNRTITRTHRLLVGLLSFLAALSALTLSSAPAAHAQGGVVLDDWHDTENGKRRADIRRMEIRHKAKRVRISFTGTIPYDAIFDIDTPGARLGDFEVIVGEERVTFVRELPTYDDRCYLHTVSESWGEHGYGRMTIHFPRTCIKRPSAIRVRLRTTNVVQVQDTTRWSRWLARA